MGNGTLIMTAEKTLIPNMLVTIGALAIVWAIYILLTGEFSSSGHVTTRYEHPIAFFFTVMVISLTGIGLLLAGFGKI